VSAQLIRGLAWPEYTLPPWLGSSALDDWPNMGKQAWAEKWMFGGYTGVSSKWMDAGSELDRLLTSANTDRSMIAAKPAGMSFATTAGKEWRAAQAGKMIIEEETLAEIDATLPMVREGLEILEEISGAKAEFQVTLRGEIAGLSIQTRPDMMLGNLFPDLKYLNPKAWTDFVRHFYGSRYWLQTGLAFGLARDAGITDPRPSFLLAESGTRNPRVKNWTISEDLCLAAWRDVCDRVEEIAEALKAGPMIDPVQFETLTVDKLPVWAQKEIQ
jgi:hypothetical protein